MIFGELATHCGYDFPTIRAMTLHDHRRLKRFWSRQPPLQEMAQAYLRIKPKATGAKSAPADQEQSFSIADLKRMYPGGVVR